jgi:acyl-coenzyme A synthetase/AMP-(fatty) acid ligase
MTGAWTNVTDAIFEHATSRPEEAAVIEGPATLTFHRFAELIGKATVYLRQQKIKPGDRVGVRMTNSTDHLILSLALLRIGATKIELSPNHAPKQLEAAIRKFSLGTLFVEPPMKLYRGARAITVDIAWRTAIEACDGDARHDDDYAPRYVDLTGLGRGVLVPHALAVARYRHLADTLAETGLLAPGAPRTALFMTGLSETAAHSFLLYQLMAGARIAVVPEFSRFYDIVRHVAYWDDAVALVTPAMCDVFLACAPKGKVLFPDVRALVNGGPPLSAENKRAMVARVTPHFHELHATAAAGWISLLRPAEMARRSETAGKPVPGMEVEILDGNGAVLPANRIGRLRCRADTAAASHLLPEDDGPRRTFRDGWVHTGDLALRDGAGFLHLKGRTSDVVVRRGIEIYPAEVEAAILSHESVREAAVIGLAVGRGGQQVVGVVVAKDGPRHDELVRHCATKLPPEKRPGAIAYTDALPRTAGGRLDRAKVRELAIRALQQAAAGKAAGTA